MDTVDQAIVSSLSENPKTIATNLFNRIASSNNADFQNAAYSVASAFEVRLTDAGRGSLSDIVDFKGTQVVRSKLYDSIFKLSNQFNSLYKNKFGYLMIFAFSSMLFVAN